MSLHDFTPMIHPVTFEAFLNTRIFIIAPVFRKGNISLDVVDNALSLLPHRVVLAGRSITIYEADWRQNDRDDKDHFGRPPKTGWEGEDNYYHDEDVVIGSRSAFAGGGGHANGGGSGGGSRSSSPRPSRSSSSSSSSSSSGSSSGAKDAETRGKRASKKGDQAKG